MSCAPYLAIRTLHQLAEDEGDEFPLAQRALRADTYVDDIVTGASDLAAALSLRNQLIGLLERGKFPLKKWVSNSSALLQDLPEEDRLRPHWKDFLANGPVQALGVAWDPVHDEMRFRQPKLELSQPATKRSVLSAIARLFDPIGWLGPFIISAKILMQDLWKEGLHWDDPLPPELTRRWEYFCKDLPNLSDIRVSRWLGVKPRDSIELHGFSDASVSAYAAVLYVRVTTKSGHSHAKLLTSKTRVAPLKTITIPRLELCAAVLLSRLIRKYIGELGQEATSVFAWSESRVVLSWLASDPSKWTPFVSHRVSEIQAASEDVIWRHVPSQDNPADIASRGASLSGLDKRSLWWTGPSWLSHPSSEWPLYQAPSTINMDAHRVSVNLCQPADGELALIERFSSLSLTSFELSRGVCASVSARFLVSNHSQDLICTPRNYKDRFIAAYSSPKTPHSLMKYNCSGAEQV